jgi:hypothetical protein
MTMIPTADAAAQLGVTKRRISDLWRAGELRGRKHSSGLFLELTSVHERAAVGPVAGRPWSEELVWGIIEALSEGRASATPETARRIGSHDALELGQRITAAVTTSRFEARDPARVRAALALTGESAVARLSTAADVRLIGDAAEIRGYTRDRDILIESHDLIESFSGPVVLHEFRSGQSRVEAEAPLALAAADCLRSADVRVRRLGLDALARLRQAWLASAT